jgi:hypothetical protein
MAAASSSAAKQFLRDMEILDFKLHIAVPTHPTAIGQTAAIGQIGQMSAFALSTRPLGQVERDIKSVTPLEIQNPGQALPWQQQSQTQQNKPRKRVFVEGPVSIIVMRHPKFNKKITFMSDIHAVEGSCESHRDDPNATTLSWLQYIQQHGQCAARQGKIVDVFAEIDFTTLQNPRVTHVEEDVQGYMFGRLLYDLIQQGCFDYVAKQQRNDVKNVNNVGMQNCQQLNPGLRFHYSDARNIDQKWGVIQSFVDPTRDSLNSVFACLRHEQNKDEKSKSCTSRLELF